MDNLEENNKFNFFNNSSIEKINLKDFEIGEKLIRCNYGFVAYCRRIRANQIYGIKVLKKKIF